MSPVSVMRSHAIEKSLPLLCRPRFSPFPVRFPHLSYSHYFALSPSHTLTLRGFVRSFAFGPQLKQQLSLGMERRVHVCSSIS